MLARIYNKVHSCKDGSAHEDDALNDIAPDNSLHAAHRAIQDGDECHKGDADVDVDTCDGSHRQRRQEEHEGGASHHEDDEQDAGHEARSRVEATFQVLVGGGDIQAPEEGKVILDDGERDQQNADLHGIVRPVGGVGLRGDAHVSDGAEHRGKDADTCRPPRDASSALEEVVAGIGGTLHEVVAEIDHSQEIEDEYSPVQPAKMGGVSDIHAGDIGAADTGLLLAADDEGAEGGGARS